jgi:ABC-type branched-subunit amino acid transport system substrate-binding protein
MKPSHVRLTLFLVFIFAVVVGVSSAQNQPVFRIGILGDPHGAIANGAALAVSEINDAGGVQGADGTRFRLELIAQPTNGGVNLANAVNNLQQASIIAALGPETGAEVLNGMQQLQSLNVPVLTPATGDTIIASDNSGRIFRIRAAQVYQGRALASYLVSDQGLQRIATAQLELDIDTTAAVIGFSTAASALNVTPQPALQIQNDNAIQQAVTQFLQANPQAVVTYGNPARAALLYNGLRGAGWTGQFAFNQIDDPAFRNGMTPEQQQNVISTTTWPFTATDLASSTFRDSYVRAFGQVPGAVEAASYDAIYLLGAAIRQPGQLLTNLTQLDNVRGVQGTLRPATLTRGETSTNVAVVQIGPFGAPQVLARYEAERQLSFGNEGTGGGQVGVGTLAPTATATPQGVVATVTRAIQNVRSGPGLNYDVIGQLRQNDQVQVIGASADLSWLVIQFRGTQGWISAAIMDVFGDPNTVPIVNPPPTPTPPPAPTAAPTPNIVIDAASVAPSPIIAGRPFTVSVTLRNAGGGPAGEFAVAATFPPNNVFSSATVPAGLAPGQTTVVNLAGTLTNTGFYSVVIVADLNKQVQPVSNTFTLSYSVNKPVLRQGAGALDPSGVFDLEGTAAQPDISWDGTKIIALGSAKLGVIPNITLETLHWDLISPTIVNSTNVPRTALNAGFIVGVLTADGNRGALRIDDIPGNQLRFTYIVYQNS